MAMKVRLLPRARMFGPTNDPFPLTNNGFAGSLGARKGPDDDIDQPEHTPIWKQVATVVALSGLVAAVETFARRAVHRLFDGPNDGKAASSSPMITMLAPEGDEEETEDDKQGDE